MTLDPLEKYNAKRDFAKTAEPAGTLEPGHGNRFIVQKHDASRLHWDFRLEVDGGVKIDNIAAIAAAGADTFVAGSAIFNTDDYAATISAMRAKLDKLRTI